MKRKSYFTKVLVLVLCLACVGVAAGTSFKRISGAKINTDYTYSVNNETVMTGDGIILYKDVYYAPVADLAAALGYNATIDGEKAVFTTPGETVKPSTPAPATPSITIDKAVITKVDFAGKTVTVYPQGKSDSAANQVVLKITNDTIIQIGRAHV